MKGHTLGILAAATLTRLLEAENLDLRITAVRDALWGRNEGVEDEDARWYAVEVFDEYVIARQGTQLFKMTYTYSEEAGVEFGEALPVSQEFVPVRVVESIPGSARLVEGAAGDSGLVWDIDIIEPGWSKNGVYYSKKALASATRLFEGVSVYFFDDEPTGHRKNVAAKTARHLAGWINGVRVREDGVLGGRLTFLQEGGSTLIRRHLLDAWQRGKTDLFGLSIDAEGLTTPGIAEGRSGRLVESIVRVSSVDVVLHPAAGGKFTRLVAAVAAEDEPPEEGNMKERLLKLLKAQRPAAYAAIDPETITIEEIMALLEEEVEQTEATSSESAETLQEARRIESRMLLREALADSRLPTLVQGRIRERLAGEVLTSEQIQEAITAERDYLAALTPARVTGLGLSRDVSVGVGKLDRLQAGVDRAFGLEITDPALRTIRPIGLRALYNELTLGGDPDVSGRLQESTQQEMLREGFDSTTLPTVMSNAMHRRLLRDYNELDYGERRLFGEPVAAADFRERTAVRLGYFGDIATVDPEDAAYAEITRYSEEAAKYAVGQKGNTITVTRRHIINDDLGAVAKIPGRLGRAARRTFARFVWSFFNTNGVIYTTKAWFHADHKNLLATPLSIAALNAGDQLLFHQTEPGSTEKLGLTPALLVVPGALKADAITLNQSQRIPGGGDNDVNPWYHHFGANNEGIVVNPLLTSDTDWGLFASSSDADILEVAFLHGQEEPELFLADQPTVGQMFTADEIVWKIRHEYGGAVVDYRSAVKSVVPAPDPET